LPKCGSGPQSGNIQVKIMKEFFRVMDVDAVLALRSEFSTMEAETIPVEKSPGRILAEDIVSDINLPDFRRTTMDGYAVQADSSFGASEANPAWLTVKGVIRMGETPDFSIRPGEAARISTGGMLPEGADSVIMIEHTAKLDETMIEAYKSVAPGQHVVEAGEDFAKGEKVLAAGRKIRPQEIGLIAAFGREKVRVFRRPVIGIISTGDEVIPIHDTPQPGQIRDINSYTLAGLVQETGGIPVCYGIIKDDFNALKETCARAAIESDMVLISGGSSVGTRDFTIDALQSLPDSKIMVHGISISPGKPTILARTGQKPFWGLPGHVVSAMVVFSVVVRPFITRMSGLENQRTIRIPARLSRSIPSAQGRVDYVRVKLSEDADGSMVAEPVLGKSGLINTMIHSDGLICIGRDVEGLDSGETVQVIIAL